MGTKRTKINIGITHFIPKTINFSELDRMVKAKKQDYESETGNHLEYNLEDKSLGIEKVEEDINLEKLVIQILYSLEGDEKIVFLFQLLRDYGYQIDHGSFARSIGIPRSRYVNILSNVRLKTYLILHGSELLLGKQMPLE